MGQNRPADPFPGFKFGQNGYFTKKSRNRVIWGHFRPYHRDYTQFCNLQIADVIRFVGSQLEMVLLQVDNCNR